MAKCLAARVASITRKFSQILGVPPRPITRRREF
jgi:hypothetical protein